jgi:tRNA threonylcarbamoyladenosine biosynthesis protein TsaB
VPDRRWLLIETSGRVGALGLGDQQRLLAERRLDSQRRHAQDLAPIAAELLAVAGGRVQELTGVAVSLGPGSYTGLRVGLMSAKSLVYVAGCDLVGVPTFEVIARQAAAFSGNRLEVIADALKRKLYVQSFARNRDDEPWRAASELAIVPVADWLSALSPKTAVTGTGLTEVENELPSHVRTVPPQHRAPSLAALLELANNGAPVCARTAYMKLEPIYLRPSSAEEQCDRRS